jgi:polysaccharide biosynthesis protein PelG
METLSYMGRNLIMLQGFICIASLALAPFLFQILGINLFEIGIFRAGVLGAALQILSLFIMVILSYFDNRKGVLLIQIIFLITNALFTWLSLSFGLAYYGYGFFASALVTFLIAAIILERYTHELPYHTFVTQNLQKLLDRKKET